MNRPPALLFGIPIADLTMSETVDLIDELVADGRASKTTHQLATVNVDFLVNALDEPEIAGILQDADVCLADGMPVVWAANLLGMPIRERVAGSDLVPLLIEASAHRGWHVHVFGSAPEVADAARRLLAHRYPDASFSIDPGPMIPDVEQVGDDVLDAIAAVEPDILCVALGNPKQERFIRAHRDRLRIPVMIGVGGSLDMLVGHRRRAPAWMQRIGLEWVARAAQEPRRLGTRYARDIRVFTPALLRELRASRRRDDGAGLLLATSSVVTATVGGASVPSEAEWAAAAARLLVGAPLEVDAQQATVAQGPAVAQLVGLVQLAQRANSTVRWTTWSPALLSQLERMGVSPALLDLPPGGQTTAQGAIENRS